MTYREAATMEQRETWGDKARAVVRVFRWSVGLTLTSGLLLAAIVAGVHECRRPDPCHDTAELLNTAVATRIECAAGSTLSVTQVATGQLARCTCGGAR